MIEFISRFKIYTDKRLWALLGLGFVSGLPFLLTLSTLSYWLAEEGISKTSIGLFMLVSIPYSIKFLWAPLLDQVKIPFFHRLVGHRRSWILLSQLFLIGALLLLAQSDPKENIDQMALAALLVSLCSATQDIVIDAYRIEILSSSTLGGAGAAMESVGFRLGMLASGAGALYLASAFGWKASYQIMAAAVVFGMVTTFLMPEPLSRNISSLKSSNLRRPNFFRKYFMIPWQQILNRNNLILILAFILFFKLGDTVLNAMCAPFLCELGYSKVEFANITKVFGIGSMVVGGLIGGVLIHHFSIVTSLVLSCVLQGVSCLMFALQSMIGYDLLSLMITIGVEGFCSGLCAASFIAYLSTLCHLPFTASHFTLLYSFGSLCRVLISTLSGWAADHVSWTTLFLLSSLAVIPAFLILTKIEKRKDGFHLIEKRQKISKIS